MAHRTVLRSLIGGLLLVMAIGWLWKAMATEPAKATRTQVVDSKLLGGDERYLTFITTVDKTVYWLVLGRRRVAAHLLLHR
jgi:hypothetical protein